MEVNQNEKNGRKRQRRNEKKCHRNKIIINFYDSKWLKGHFRMSFIVFQQSNKRFRL